MEEKEHSLKYKWVLWFHKVDDENWKEDSYIKVYDIETYEDIIFVIQEIPNITSGMFFLMKRGIFPTYEDPENQNGGYWSLRITKKDTYDMWQKLLYYICVDRITKDDKTNEQINGFTISPKINNCIFKIWTKNYKSMKGDNLRGDIEGIYPQDTFYLQHRADN